MATLPTSKLSKESMQGVKERLSQWESRLATLTDKQKDSYMSLAAQATHQPLPLDLLPDDGFSLPQRPPTSRSVGTVATKGRSSSEDLDMLEDRLQGLAREGQAVETAQQFLSWFAKVENVMQEEDEAQYRSYLAHVSGYSEQCSSILSDINDATEQLQRLRQQYGNVSTRTGALHSACEQLLADQTRLVTTAESISEKLIFFDELETISHKLNSPLLSVMSESFMPILTRLSECISYLLSHPQLKESAVYLARFRQCQTKALGLIKQHTISTLCTAAQQVSPKKGEQPSSTEDMFGLFFGKFRTCAPRIKLLMDQVEEKAAERPEFQLLLQDCQQCYFTQRLALLQPSVTYFLRQLVEMQGKDPAALMRAGGTFMVRLCQDEYQLYMRFFSQHSTGIDELLEALSVCLYDELRPCIIHLNQLEALADLCIVLKAELLEDHVALKPEELAAFGGVAEQMLEDVQQRLVYRAQAYMQSDIQNYSPASGDLAYPDKLQMSRQAEPVSVSSEGASMADSPVSMTASIPREELPPADQQAMWYPTLRRTLVCLSKLYRCINKTIFEGLSQEALTICVASLVQASLSISRRKDQLNGQLFLIKHLLILREQIAPFDVNFAVREVGLDFSRFKDAAFSLFNHRHQLFKLNYQNALLEFVLQSGPTVRESYIDSKKDIDNHLKRACEEFISSVTQALTAPIQEYLTKASTLLDLAQSGAGSSKIKLSRQPFADPRKVHEVVNKNFQLLEKGLPSVLQLMRLYLANRDTEYILFKPIKGNVLQCYRQLSELVQANYSEEDQQIVACPATEQVAGLLVTPS